MAKEDEGKEGQDDQDGAGRNELDVEVESILKSEDPAAAVKKLILTKREANGESQKRRLAQEKLQKEKEAAEKKTLEEQGKFKELAEKAEGKAKAAEERQARVLINAELRVAAIQAGIVDPKDAVALCDRSSLKIGEDGETVEGVTEAVDALKKAKPYLFGVGGDGQGGQDGKPNVPAPGDKKPALRGVLNKTGGMSVADRITAGLERKN